MKARYWVSRHGGIWLASPFNRDWIDDMKGMVPYPQRRWNQEAKMWWIGDKFVRKILSLTEQYFGPCSPGSLDGFQEPPHPHVREGKQSSKKQQWSSNQQSSNQQSSSSFRDDLFTNVRHLSDYRTLYLVDTAPFEVIKASYKTLSHIYHPDRGGDPEMMIAINNAYERLKRKLSG